MDNMGPLPEVRQGNKHLLVAIDHFAKWCKVVPTKDQRPKTLAENLASRVFSRFGTSTVIHSDQGRNCESNLMQEACCLMGILESRKSTYHPKCDGLLKTQLQRDWDRWVDFVTYAYNISVQYATSYRPYEMDSGCFVHTTLELELGLPLKSPCS